MIYLYINEHKNNRELLNTIFEKYSKNKQNSFRVNHIFNCMYVSNVNEITNNCVILGII